jgi:hypothetical protein
MIEGPGYRSGPLYAYHTPETFTVAPLVPSWAAKCKHVKRTAY